MSTPRALIGEAARRLAEAGVPDAVHDAAVLLSHLTGVPPLTLRLDTDGAIDAAVIEAYRELIAKRAARTPLQWLTGTQPFLDLDFEVNGDVLIPRPETAMLAERAIALGTGKPGFRMLDLCCGSGCIAITAALHLPGAEITACDLSPKALRTAQANARRLNADVRFREGDLFEAVDGMSFDLIVSNPPYIPSAECDALQEEVRMEPRMALDGGADGLDFYRRIAGEAGGHLTRGGRVLLEVGLGQAEDVSALLEQGGSAGIRVTDDFAGIPRMVEAVWS